MITATRYRYGRMADVPVSHRVRAVLWKAGVRTPEALLRAVVNEELPSSLAPHERAACARAVGKEAT